METGSNSNMVIDWKWEVIWNNLDAEKQQQLGASKEELISSLYYELLAGGIKIYGIEKYRVVVIVVAQSQFVGEVHIFSESKDNWGLVKALKALTKWYWKNSDHIKLEMRSPYPQIAKLAKRCGFEYEGTRRKSFVLQNGDILDELEYGLVRPEEYNG